MSTLAFNDIALQFRLGDWRNNNKCRNELVRAAALHAVDNMVDLAGLSEELRLAVQYRQMEKRDRNGFDVSLYYFRRIARGWQFLDPADQDDFRTGKAPPSRLVARLKKFTKR